MSILSLSNVSKGFGGNPVLRDISLSVEVGEFVAILGFSGTGKTTLINLIAGLEKPDTGTLTYRDKPITGPAPERGLVFQSYSLMPWLTVRGNVLLAVQAVSPKLSKAEKAARADHFIGMVGRSHAALRRPADCPAACANASPSLARWRCHPICCCSTNPCPRWMP